MVQSPTAFRDRALIGFAFASGGRRRSEVSNLTVEMTEDLGFIKSKTFDDLPNQETTELRSMLISLGRTKTTGVENGLDVYLTGDPVQWLDDWILQSGIIAGPVFRNIDRWGNVGKSGLSPAGINLIVKQRIAEIGENPKNYSAHGFRSGYLTTAALDGIAIGAAMAQSGHRSVDQAMSYFNEADRATSRAANLLGNAA